MKIRSLLLLTLLAVSASSFADEPAAGAPPAGMPHGGTAPIMFRAGGIGTIGYLSRDLSSVGIAYLPVDHVMVAANLALTYNGNGDVMGVGTGNWSSALLVAVEYMVKDAMPFAMGPAIAAMFSFAPGDAFSTVMIAPSWDLWYTPWNAPVAIGAAMGLTITLQKGLNPIVALSTPALRLAYTF